MRHPAVGRYAICLLALGACLAGGAPARTRACAHRGDKEAAPENTLPAILSAVKKGAPQIEFDVKLSSGGQMVVMHDQTVDRTTSGKGKVAELTFEKLRSLDAGAWFSPRFAGTRIPTMREVLDTIPSSVQCNVHLANVPELAGRAARTLKEAGHLKNSFLACTVKQAEEARAAVPGIRICVMDGQRAVLEAYAKTAIEAKGNFVQVRGTRGIPADLAAGVKTLHEHGILVNYFGANDDEATIRQLVAAGVDYVLTDKLDFCQRLLREISK